VLDEEVRSILRLEPDYLTSGAIVLDD